MKICFIGPAEAGKTTLCKAIERGRLKSFVAAEENAKETGLLEERTIGMEAYEVTIPSVGHVFLCDFAGQEYFHGTHDVFFDPVNTFYIVLVNGRDSEKKILQYCHHWLAFLSSSLPPHSIPVVVMVMSRGDLFPQRQLHDLMQKVVRQMRIKFHSQLNIQHQFFILDCRKSWSNQMKLFKSFIAQIKNKLLQVMLRLSLLSLYMADRSLYVYML